MLDSLKWLGEKLEESGTTDFLQGMVKPIKRKMNRDKEEYLVKLIFDIDEGRIHVDYEVLTEFDKRVFVGWEYLPRSAKTYSSFNDR